METLTVNYLSFWKRPFKVDNTEMAPNILLMCKMFIVLLYAHSFYGYLNDPFLPVLPVFDEFNNIPNVFNYVSKALFLLASVALLFNFRVKTMSIVVGLVIIVNLLASKPIFKNHLFIIGCVLLLAGLSSKNKSPLLIYMQLGIIYIGALLNKAFQLDWWSGQFMHNWLGNALDNAVYLWIAEQLPDYLFSKILSYTAMLSEFVIVLLLFLPRWRHMAPGVILVFHTLLFTFTAQTFGVFMEDILIVLIAFLVWPKKKSILTIKSFHHFKCFKILSFLDFDNRVQLEYNEEMKNRLLLLKDKHKYNNWAAFTEFLLQCNGFFMLIFVVEMGIRYVFNGAEKYIMQLLLFWIFIMILSPLFFRKNNIREA